MFKEIKNDEGSRLKNLSLLAAKQGCIVYTNELMQSSVLTHQKLSVLNQIYDWIKHQNIFTVNKKSRTLRTLNKIW
jgi:hypothetical protein